jgi:ribosomal protein S18 acetylase RimI-like enzyme
MSSRIYRIYSIHDPPQQSDIDNYANLRLLSLKTDPHCFTSTHQRESKFTQEQWRSRLTTRDKVVLVALGTSSDRSTHEEWLGMVAFLSPEALRSVSFCPPNSTHAGENARVYGLFAMWVHPSHRGKGLGRKLIEAGFAWVQANSEARAVHSYAVALQVKKDNLGAKSLYRTTGFQKVQDEGDNEIWMISRE